MPPYSACFAVPSSLATIPSLELMAWDQMGLHWSNGMCGVKSISDDRPTLLKNAKYNHLWFNPSGLQKPFSLTNSAGLAFITELGQSQSNVLREREVTFFFQWLKSIFHSTAQHSHCQNLMSRCRPRNCSSPQINSKSSGFTHTLWNKNNNYNCTNRHHDFEQNFLEDEP